MPGRFLEAIVAPGFEPDALALPHHQADLEEQRPPDRPAGADRPVRPGPLGPRPAAGRGRAARPGLGRDRARPGRTAGRDGARARPSDERAATWGSPGGSARRSSRTRSCVARDGQLVGVGAGQMSRLDSVRIAVEKAGRSGPGRRARLRRLLPVPRRPRRRRRGGRHRDHPARRLEARRRDPRRLRRARHGHDPDRPPPFPPLRGCERIDSK